MGERGLTSCKKNKTSRGVDRLTRDLFFETNRVQDSFRFITVMVLAHDAVELLAAAELFSRFLRETQHPPAPSREG